LLGPEREEKKSSSTALIERKGPITFFSRKPIVFGVGRGEKDGKKNEKEKGRGRALRRKTEKEKEGSSSYIKPDKAVRVKRKREEGLRNGIGAEEKGGFSCYPTEKKGELDHFLKKGSRTVPKGREKKGNGSSSSGHRKERRRRGIAPGTSRAGRPRDYSNTVRRGIRSFLSEKKRGRRGTLDTHYFEREERRKGLTTIDPLLFLVEDGLEGKGKRERIKLSQKKKEKLFLSFQAGRKKGKPSFYSEVKNGFAGSGERLERKEGRRSLVRRKRKKGGPYPHLSAG